MTTPKNKVSKQQALAELWRRGVLNWKCHSVQTEMYNLFYNAPDNSTLVWLLSRQIGKSFLLAILALEQALREPHSITKLLTDTKVHVRSIFEKIFEELLVDCPQELRPTYAKSDFEYTFYNGSKIQLAGSDNGHYERLRGQKCLAKDTLIMTPTGPKKIQDIKIGEKVYGYNEDRSVSLTEVKDVISNGTKEVIDLYKKGQFLLSATNDHKFLTVSQTGHFRDGGKKLREKQLRDIHEDNTRITKSHVNIPCGYVNEPHAYALGALIGDGCISPNNGNTVLMSSENNTIPNKVAEILNLKVAKTGGNNFTWKITTQSDKYKHCKNINFNHYENWCKHKYSYEKTFDWDVVNTWDRQSCLNLLAGLVDTDGSVYSKLSENTLELSITTTSPELKDNICKLIYKMYQVMPRIKTRKMDKKSKHQAYDVKIRSGAQVKRILKELSPYLVLDYKKYQDSYDNFHSKESLDCVKIEKRSNRMVETFDLEVDNKTHLFLTADGIVTHNSSLVLVDEAGFCNNMEDVVKSVLLPTTTHTGGKIILASTPPPDPNHDFYKFIEEAELNGTLTRKTIYDNPLLKPEQIARIEKEMGGKGSVKFRREYLCHHIRDEENVIFPELDETLEKQIIKVWPKPPFYNAYVSMDLGFHDLSVILFAYHDFRSDKIIVEDELIIKGKDFKLPDVVQMIKKKEEQLWMNILTNEQIKPKLRVSDINLIVTNEIARESNNEIIFQPTRKDEAEAAMNNLRVMIANGKIIINPACETTIRHLKNAKWSIKQGKKQLARSPDMGHYDAVDALKYLIRNVSFNSNPYPAHYGMDLKNLHVQNPSKFYKDNISQNQADVWKNIFNIKGKR